MGKRAVAGIDAEAGESPLIDDLVGYNLKRVYMIFQSDFRTTLGADGPSPRVFSVLALIVGAPGITQSEVARRLGIERSGLVAIVDALQERGYAERTPIKGDRRVQALSPTEAGIAAYLSGADKIRRHEDQLLSVLNDGERAALQAILAKLRLAHEGTPT